MGVQLKLHPLDSYAKLIFEINCIGNNINQLAYKANGKGIAPILEVKAARLMLAEIRAVYVPAPLIVIWKRLIRR